MNLPYLDKTIFFLINHSAVHPILDGLMPFLSSRGYVLLIPYLIYLFWIASMEQYKQRGFNVSVILKITVISICSVLLSDWIGNELKNTIMRVRPCHVLENVRLLAGCTSSGSLPSNHAANSFAYAIPLFYLTRNYTIGLARRFYPLVLASLVAL